jgi:hypothetical protein
MNSIVRFGTIALTVALGACAGSDSASPPGDVVTPPGDPGKTITVVRLRSEPYSFAYNTGLVESDRIVVRDAATWQTVWNKVWQNAGDVPPLPAVDFSSEMILVAALGSRNSGGYGILIDGATEAGDDGIDVVIRSISPGSGCGTTLALTQPVDIARLPLRAGKIEFTERAEVTSCQ